MLMFYEQENQAGDDAKILSRGSTIGKELEGNMEAYAKIALSSINVLETVPKILTKLGEELKNLVSLEKTMERLIFLDEESAKINKTLGLGAQKADEFRKLIIDTSAKYAELGLGLDQIGKDYIALSNVFNTNISISDETLTELAATTVVTGQKGDALAKAFRGVGVDIAGIAPRMLEVTEVAKQAGVTVGSVAAGVVKHIDKMNLYNFEGGVKGLAKMSAQASRLGIDMDKVFALTNKVFNPEGAIEVAAAMQRLGVATGALVDPLRLMDLSQNDPAELQNQIVNMTKDFVRFNKDLGEFQILPGEKRRLEEIAGALGLNNGELQRMALNAANLEYKMKQIKFAPGTSKEDREMIATLAQINKSGVAELKVKQYAYDEKTGKEEWTGEYEMVDATKVTATQLKALKESQELKGATMEEIAIKQQGELEGLNNKVGAIKTAVAFGVTRTSAAQGLYKMGTTGVKNALFADETNPDGVVPKSFRDAENVGKAMQSALEAVNPEFVTLKRNINDVNKVTEISAKIGQSAIDLLTKMGESASDLLTNLDITKLKSLGSDVLTKIMGTSVNGTNVGGGGTNSSTVNSSVNSNSVNSSNLNSVNSNVNNINNSNTPKPQELNLNEKVTVDVNVNLDPAAKDQALTYLINQELTKFFGPEGGNKNIAFVLDEIAKQKTQNNLVQSNVPK
jgi:hypothetical protein